MNKLNYALTMLTTAGVGVTLAPAANAVTLYGVFTEPMSSSNSAFTETFTLQSDGGVADVVNGVHFTDFALTNDSLSNTVAVVGDSTTGFKAFLKKGSDSYFGTGTTVTLGAGNTDSFLPPFFSPSPNPGVLAAGSYTADFAGGSLTLTGPGGVPEPEAWALLIAGASMVGGARRASRRRMALAA